MEMIAINGSTYKELSKALEKKANGVRYMENVGITLTIGKVEYDLLVSGFLNYSQGKHVREFLPTWVELHTHVGGVERMNDFSLVIFKNAIATLNL